MSSVVHNYMHEWATLRCACADIHALTHQAVTDDDDYTYPTQDDTEGLTA